jgi:hypothetical protein
LQGKHPEQGKEGRKKGTRDEHEENLVSPLAEPDLHL